MQWNNFLCSSPPQSKLFLRDNINSSKSKSKSRPAQSNQRHTTSKRVTGARKESPTLGNRIQHSISSLFVREMNKDEAHDEYMKQMLDAMLEIRDIQKQQLQCNKKIIQLLNENTIKKQKPVGNRKKNSNFFIENYIRTKYKQIDKFKNDLTLLKKSRSNQNTQKKSYNMIRMLK